MEGLVKRSFATIKSVANSSNVDAGFSRVGAGLDTLHRQFGSTTGAANRFSQSIDRMSAGLSSGLGIGIALSGLAMLERGFQKAIEKAQQFQTAQLSIAATLGSNYKYTTAGGAPVNAHDTYIKNLGESAKIVNQIIERQRHNILTFQEQLSAYQGGANAGARKGLDTRQILDISERLAVVGKSLGLSGERLADNVRILMGGGVNAARSVLGRTLGVSNEDIKSRQGQDYVKFIEKKTQGFGKESQQNFKESIVGVLSTTESAIDVYAAKIGQKFFEKTKPIIQELGKSLQGLDADKVATTLANLFSAVAKGLQSIAESPALQTFAKLLDMFAGEADKIVIAAVILKVASALRGAGVSAIGFMNVLKGTGVAAAEAAVANEKLAVSVEKVALAEGLAGGSRGRINPSALDPALLARGPSQSLASRDVAASMIGGAYGANGIPAEAIAAGIQRQGRSARLGGLVRGVEENRARLNSSFDEFSAMNAGMPAAMTAEERQAQLGRMKAARDARNENNINRGQRGLMFAGLAYGATDLVRDYTGTQGGGHPIEAAAQTGTTVGAGLLGAGLGLNPATIGITVFATALTGLTAVLKDAADAAEDAEAKHAAFRKANPMNAIVEDDKAAIQHLKDQQTKGKFTGSIQGDKNWLSPGLQQIWADVKAAPGVLASGFGLFGNRQAPMSAFTPTRTGLSADEQAQNKKSQDAAEAKLRSDTRAWQSHQSAINENNDADQQLKKLQGQVTGLGLGYGLENDRTKMVREARLKDMQINASAAKNELYVSPEQQKRADARAKEIQDEIAEKDKFQARFPKAAIGYSKDEQDYADKDASQRIGQEIARKDLIAQNKSRTASQTSLFDASKAIEGLSIVKAGDNTVEEAQLLFKTINAKLDDASKVFGVNADQIAAMRLQARANLDATTIQRKYEDAHGSLGNDDYATTVGKAVSGLITKSLGRAGDEFSATGNTPAEALARRESEIESKRAEVDNFDQFRSSSLSTFEKQNAMSALGGGGLTVDEQVARSMREAQEKLADNALAQQGENDSFSRRTQDRRLERQENPLRIAEADRNVQSAQLNAQKAALAPVLDTGQGPYSGVASAIKYSVDAQQGFDPKAYEQAYRDSIEIKKKEAVAAQENANLQVQEAALARQRLGLGLERSDEDYQKAVNDHNIAIRKLAENAQQLSEGMARAQADLAKAASYMAGGENSVHAGALADVGRAMQESGIRSFTISPTINTTVNVSPETSLDANARAQLKREIADSIEQDLDRACKRGA